MPSIRIIWTYFKEGYSEIGYVLSAVQLGLAIYTALILTLTSIPKTEVLLLLIAVGALSVCSMISFGRWQYTSHRSLYKKDAETEALNNPFMQAQNRLLVELAKKAGVNTAEFEKKWIRST